MPSSDLIEQVYTLAHPQCFEVERSVCKELIAHFSRIYRITVSWFDNRTGPNTSMAGYFEQSGKNRTIFLGEHSFLHPLYVFFHELGHLFCKTREIWKAYHELPYKTGSGRIRFRRRTARIAKITGYRAECWVDRWAIRECAKWFPRFKFQVAYLHDKTTKSWLLEKHLIPCYNSSLK